MKVKSYRDLIVWQKSVDLVTEVYKILRSFPEEEKFGLTSQLKRSCISIPSNIAEGYGRKYIKDYVRFLQISRGSLFEMQTQIQISINLGCTTEKQINTILETSVEIEKMLNTLIKKLTANT